MKTNEQNNLAVQIDNDVIYYLVFNGEGKLVGMLEDNIRKNPYLSLFAIIEQCNIANTYFLYTPQSLKFYDAFSYLYTYLQLTKKTHVHVLAIETDDEKAFCIIEDWSRKKIFEISCPHSVYKKSMERCLDHLIKKSFACYSEEIDKKHNLNFLSLYSLIMILSDVIGEAYLSDLHNEKLKSYLKSKYATVCDIKTTIEDGDENLEKIHETVISMKFLSEYEKLRS